MHYALLLVDVVLLICIDKHQLLTSLHFFSFHLETKNTLPVLGEESKTIAEA